MDPRSLLCLLAFVACLGLVLCQEKKEMKIDAAYAYKEGDTYVLHMFSGDNVHVFHRSLGQTILTKKDLELPEDFGIQAAFIPKGNSNKRIFYGEDSGYAVNYGTDATTLRKLQYGSRRVFLHNGGPDAAGRLGDKIYVFKGCQFSIRSNWDSWSEPEVIQNVVPEFPCDLDAAFNMDECLYVVKGASTWRWCELEEVKGVSGPMPMNKVFSFLDNWVVKE